VLAAYEARFDTLLHTTSTHGYKSEQLDIGSLLFGSYVDDLLKVLDPAEKTIVTFRRQFRVKHEDKIREVEHIIGRAG